MSKPKAQFILRTRVKELLEENHMTVRDLAERIELPYSTVNTTMYADFPLVEKEYINVIINEFGLTYEQFFLPQKTEKQAKDVIGFYPQRLINLIGDKENMEYLDLSAYFKASGYTCTYLIAHIVDHWYDFMSDDWISGMHPLRKNPIKVPSGYKNKKSFIGEKGNRPGSYKDWLLQY